MQKLYIDLYHGRKTKTEEMDDWGLLGPVLGPVEWVQTTYGWHYKFIFTDYKAATTSGFKDTLGELVSDEGLILFQGIYYGDTVVFQATEEAVQEIRNSDNRIACRPYMEEFDET